MKLKFFYLLRCFWQDYSFGKWDKFRPRCTEIPACTLLCRGLHRETEKDDGTSDSEGKSLSNPMPSQKFTAKSSKPVPSKSRSQRNDSEEYAEYDENDLIKLKETNACKNVISRGADLSGESRLAKLQGADLTES